MTIQMPDEVIEAVAAIAATRIDDLAPMPDLWTWGIPIPKRKKLNSKKVYLRRIRIAERYGPNCAYCGFEFVDLTQATIDHVIPYRLVAHWQGWNLVLACAPCNKAKSTKIPERLIPLLCDVFLPTRQSLRAVNA